VTWAVRFEDVSKEYFWGGPQYATLRDELARLGRRVRTLWRREASPRSGRTALDHVSFEVEEGETYALIGPNGAGKTTALKLLARISSPTSGRVRFRGRIGALIEIGAGIHLELTGRENIWLYGRIAGMSRQVIARRFDEIVDFAELSHALDVPVKMYSSGMQMRLGFAIASHIDPDIFLVDEALSVGDTGFQAKCVERINKLVGEGKTLLFVSHSLSMVEAICRRGLFLLDGRMAAEGQIHDVLRPYLDWIDAYHQQRFAKLPRESSSGAPAIERVTFLDSSGAERTAFRTGEDIEVRLTLHARQPIIRPIFSLGIADERPGNLILCSTPANGAAPDRLEGSAVVSCRIRRLPLLPRVYQVRCSVRNGHDRGDLHEWQAVGALRVAEEDGHSNGSAAISVLRTDAPIHAEYEWKW
jgi:homopolymeric O-antigen transport system ATP-binding protein